MNENINLSEHLTLAEMEHSDTAMAKGVDNSAPPEVIEHLKRFAVEVFEPVRLFIGKPVHVSSGFRCRELEIAIGSGIAVNQHLTGNAADIHVDGMTLDGLFDMLRVNASIPYDQLITEGGCVHISGGVDKPRRMAMIQHKIPGGFSYEHVANHA
jgi:zinc D-Ala-D-Ala carboxypeptidase